MKRIAVLLGAILVAASPCAVLAQDTTPPVAMIPAPTYEYVQQAESLQYDGETLALQGVPSTIFFSDRPYRLSGQVDTETFAKLWVPPAGPFAIDPPNAAVSVLNDRGNPPAIIELTSAEARDGGISYGVKVLSGTLPSDANNIALFVDNSRAVPGPYCYHAPQAPECRYHPYYPPPYHPAHPGAAFAAGAVTGAAIASAAQPKVYVYPVPTGPLPAECHLNGNHTRMICSVPVQ